MLFCVIILHISLIILVYLCERWAVWHVFGKAIRSKLQMLKIRSDKEKHPLKLGAYSYFSYICSILTESED